jgi:hypothetical protein
MKSEAARKRFPPPQYRGFFAASMILTLVSSERQLLR